MVQAWNGKAALRWFMNGTSELIYALLEAGCWHRVRQTGIVRDIEKRPHCMLRREGSINHGRLA